MEILASLHKRREEILDIADCHGAFNVRMFGSEAREEKTQDSDTTQDLVPL